jgi:cyclic beta-1,2-glucan synthetase
VRLSFATGIASDRATAQALAQKYRDPSAASRTFALAFTNAQSGLRHLGISHDDAVLFERLASRVLFADGTLRASPDAIGANTLGQAGLWPHGISGDLPILPHVVGDDDVDWRQVPARTLASQGAQRRRRHLNENPSSYLDEIRSSRPFDNGPWRLSIDRAGRILPGDAIGVTGAR